jgi:cytochrome c-type biogenesis protein CcmH/NrfG
MSDVKQTENKGWSSIQVYTLSAICLLAGVSGGYLFRGSKASQAAVPAAVQTQSGNSAGALPPNASQPSADDMKRMAEKQVAPLLEQLKSNPNDADTLAKVAHFYMAAGQYGEAVTYYEKATAVKPTPNGYTELSIAYYNNGAGDKAIDALNRALKIDPKFANALFDLGVLKWQAQGDTKGAVECWETLLKTNPNHPRRAEVEKLIAEVKKHANMAPGTKTDKPSM